jgi:hypothetical protein
MNAIQGSRISGDWHHDADRLDLMMSGWVVRVIFGALARCRLLPRLRPNLWPVKMVETGQKQTFCAAANNDLFDHVGSGEDRLWDGEAQRLGGF